MRKLDESYILLGLLWLVAGMIFGIWMGIGERFELATVHAHMNLVGFAASVMFGLILRAFPSIMSASIAKLQFMIYQLGAVVLCVGKVVVQETGNPLLVIIGSFIILAGATMMLYLFAAKR